MSWHCLGGKNLAPVVTTVCHDPTRKLLKWEEKLGSILPWQNKTLINGKYFSTNLIKSADGFLFHVIDLVNILLSVLWLEIQTKWWYSGTNHEQNINCFNVHISMIQIIIAGGWQNVCSLKYFYWMSYKLMFYSGSLQEMV